MTAALTDAGSPPGTEGTGQPTGTELPGPGIGGPVRPTATSTLKLVLLGVGCSAAWLASVLVGGFLDPGPEIHRIALAGHILALVLSFGAILVLDWVGLLWLLGRRDVHDTRRLDSAAQPLIWGGLAILLISGALLHPDLSSPPTQIKLVSILVLMLNGLVLTKTMKQLHQLPPETLFTAVAAGLRARLLAALCISQTCWWTSVLVGLLNSTLRRWTGA
ncbi:hypothetical protein SRABI26_02337 [Arthrobacter sp. Bi26]|uniref:hypothetical protein n=1 Tax=Arthrobacter sp. Bi26 TaxID=2822350 RepID=UPI001DDA46EE|nr:hypothetical protein [Arthrobacter sp. Bi26]CAH0218225.1 hypothetical protein SRABI26_02337 [Arthrobacter sp. Bi26]